MRQGKKGMDRSFVPLLAALLILMTGATAVQAGPSSTTGGYLGVYTSNIDAAMLEALDFEEDGILINDVIRDTPAEEAGLKAGDIIMKVGDRKMISTKSLKRALWRIDPGEETTIVYWRDGKEKTVKVKVAEKPDKEFGHDFFVFDDDDGSHSWSFSSSTKKRAFLGVQVESLNDQLAEFFGVEEDQGALIKEVVKDSPAEKIGLKAGDVILSVDGDEIDGSGDVTRAIRDREPGEEVEVVVMRDKKKKTFKATLDEKDSGVFFNRGTVGYMVQDMLDDMPDVKVEMEELREELKDLKVKVKELGD